MEELTLTLVVGGLSVKDAIALAAMVFELAKKDLTRNYSLVLHGLEGKPPEEAKKILREIFPPGGVAA